MLVKKTFLRPNYSATTTEGPVGRMSCDSNWFTSFGFLLQLLATSPPLVNHINSWMIHCNTSSCFNRRTRHVHPTFGTADLFQLLCQYAHAFQQTFSRKRITIHYLSKYTRKTYLTISTFKKAKSTIFGVFFGSRREKSHTKGIFKILN